MFGVKKLIECHNKKPQPIPNTKRKRKWKEINACKIKRLIVNKLVTLKFAKKRGEENILTNVFGAYMMLRHSNVTSVNQVAHLHITSLKLNVT